MKHFNPLICFFLIICCQSVSYSQKVSVGIYSGVNFSDIHGQETGGKWGFKPGPVQGFKLEYFFTRSLGVQTGIDFSSVFYSHKYTPVPSTYIYPAYYPVIAPYYQEFRTMDFSSVRVPVLFAISLPTKLQFRMRGGIFYSFIKDLDITYYTEKHGKNDFGYVFSSGISYPFNDKFKATFDVGYSTGRKKFLENYNYRHGSSDVTMGIAYTGFLKNKITKNASKNEVDTASGRISVTFRGGMNYSWNKALPDSVNYGGYMGALVGFNLNLPLGQGNFFQTGFLFERKGYSIQDSSSSYYKIIRNENQVYVDTKVQTDWAIIPALLCLPVGNKGRVKLSTGPWFGFKLNARTVGAAYSDYHSVTSYQLKKTIVYEDLEKAIKDYDLGWIFGLGISIPVVKEYEVDLNFQYSTGFRDVFDISGTGEKYNPYKQDLSIRNRSISLVLGFRIPSADR